MATMDDIARQLGVSKGTVSKALSGSEDISVAMRKAVLEKAVELGYTRVTRANKKSRVAVFIENMDYEDPEGFGWNLVIGFRKMAEPAGFAVDIIPLTSAMQREFRYDEYMMKYDYKGAFFLGVNYMDPWLSDFRTCRTPAVLLDNKVRYNAHIAHIGVDNYEGMANAVWELKGLGHKKIGYLSSELGSYVYQDRSSAFFSALEQHAMPTDRNLAGYHYYSTECITQNLPRLLDLGCTAIICSHDLLAHSLMIYCAESGIRVPKDLSIMGVDDLPLCTHTSPTLSTIRQDRMELGKSAFYALDCQMNSIHINSLLLHSEVILRGSVGPAPVSEE